MNKKPNTILVSTFVPIQSAEKNLADKKRWKGLKNVQILTLRNVLPRALNYHFNNFKKLEEKGAPENSFDKSLTGQEWAEIKESRLNIKFEVQAYICQLRRTKFFIHSMKLSPPKDLVLKEIWDSIMDKKGMVNVLSNKWASHRSIDDQRKEDTENLHRDVLLNLEGGATAWQDRCLILQVSGYRLDLCNFHPKVLEFVNWIFSETEHLMIIK